MSPSRLAIALLTPLALAACGGDEPPPGPTSYAPLKFDYLTKLSLNVGNIDIENRATPLGEADVAAQSPVAPADALTQMAHDRLFAAGSMGQAVFTIDQASIVREPGGVLDGQLAVHVEILTAGGARAGYAEARVARQHVAGSAPENQAAVEYDMTRQMMGDMNVELEYQVRRTLGDWLVTTSAVPPPVVAAPLPSPGPAPLPSPGPAPQAEPPPDAEPPMPAPEEAPPQEMSPPPGYLQLPQGEQPPL